jgi:MEDS: MEthanogen/methylotroph, DcmR Sensory domain
MTGMDAGVPGVGNLERGTHLCALYSGPVERDDLLMPFVQAGLREGDKCLCLIDQVEPQEGWRRPSARAPSWCGWCTSSWQVQEASHE